MFNNWILRRGKKPWFVACANFCAVNTHIMADFKLPTWCHHTQNWEEMCLINFCKAGARCPLAPLLMMTRLRYWFAFKTFWNRWKCSFNQWASPSLGSISPYPVGSHWCGQHRPQFFFLRSGVGQSFHHSLVLSVWSEVDLWPSKVNQGLFIRLVFGSRQTGKVCLPLHKSHGDMSLGIPEAIFPATRRDPTRE